MSSLTKSERKALDELFITLQQKESFFTRVKFVIAAALDFLQKLLDIFKL